MKSLYKRCLLGPSECYYRIRSHFVIKVSFTFSYTCKYPDTTRGAAEYQCLKAAEIVVEAGYSPSMANSDRRLAI